MTSTTESTASSSAGSLLYRMLKPFGIWYTISYILKYPARHRSSNFTARIRDIQRRYSDADDAGKRQLTGEFESIVDALVLPNGVRKTTYSERMNAALTALCENDAYRFDKDSIDVLDIPSSVGLSSIDLHRQIDQHQKIGRYVLADQFFEVLYDPEYDCIYDDSGELLQVGKGESYFSIYRPHSSGDAFGLLAKLIIWPLEMISASYRRRLPFNLLRHYEKIVLLHPEAEARVKQGDFEYMKADIFAPLKGSYDLILSFNLLQKNYFPQQLIDAGINNLADALNEGGILVRGNTESYEISRKIDGELVPQESQGDF